MSEPFGNKVANMSSRNSKEGSLTSENLLTAHLENIHEDTSHEQCEIMPKEETKGDTGKEFRRELRNPKEETKQEREPETTLTNDEDRFDLKITRLRREESKELVGSRVDLVDLIDGWNDHSKNKEDYLSKRKEARTELKRMQDIELQNAKKNPLQYYDTVMVKYFDKSQDAYKYLYESARKWKWTDDESKATIFILTPILNTRVDKLVNNYKYFKDKKHSNYVELTDRSYLSNIKRVENNLQFSEKVQKYPLQVNQPVLLKRLDNGNTDMKIYLEGTKDEQQRVKEWLLTWTSEESQRNSVIPETKYHLATIIGVAMFKSDYDSTIKNISLDKKSIFCIIVS